MNAQYSQIDPLLVLNGLVERISAGGIHSVSPTKKSNSQHTSRFSSDVLRKFFSYPSEETLYGFM